MANVVATPQQLAVMAQVLDAYCMAFSVYDREGRERIGLLLLQRSKSLTYHQHLLPLLLSSFHDFHFPPFPIFFNLL